MGPPAPLPSPRDTKVTLDETMHTGLSLNEQIGNVLIISTLSFANVYCHFIFFVLNMFPMCHWGMKRLIGVSESVNLCPFLIKHI